MDTLHAQTWIRWQVWLGISAGLAGIGSWLNTELRHFRSGRQVLDCPNKRSGRLLPELVEVSEASRGFPSGNCHGCPGEPALRDQTAVRPTPRAGNTQYVRRAHRHG